MVAAEVGILTYSFLNVVPQILFTSSYEGCKIYDCSYARAYPQEGMGMHPPRFRARGDINANVPQLFSPKYPTRLLDYQYQVIVC